MKTQLTPEQLEKRKKTNVKIFKYGCLPIIIVLVLALGAGMILGDNKTETVVTETPIKADYSSEAFIISQKYVKAQLNYPAEAEFNFLPDLAEEQEENLYRIVGSVTAKNALGVKSEIQYLCRLKYLGGDPMNIESWKLVDISL